MEACSKSNIGIAVDATSMSHTSVIAILVPDVTCKIWQVAMHVLLGSHG